MRRTEQGQQCGMKGGTRRIQKRRGRMESRFKRHRESRFWRHREEIPLENGEVHVGVEKWT